MTGVLDIPPEIIHQICASLSPTDRSQLLATCQTIRDTLNVITWRNVILRSENVSAPPTLLPKSRNQPYFIQHLGNPLELFEFENPRPKATVIGGSNFVQLCHAVYYGFYDSAFQWVKTLTIDIPFEIEDCLQELDPQTKPDFDKINGARLFYWFLLHAVPRFKNIKLVQIDVRLAPDVENLEQTILPLFLRQCVPLDVARQVSISGLHNQNVNLNTNVEFFRASPVSKRKVPVGGSSFFKPPWNPGLFCTYIPLTVKRVDLWFDDTTTYTTSQLAALLGNCTQLYSLSLANIKLLDNDLPWIPSSVHELSLQDTVSKDYFMIPEQEARSVRFLHLYSEGACGFLTADRLQQIRRSFPKMDALYIEKFKIELEFLNHLNILLPQLKHFSFMGMLGYYFEEFDLRQILASGLSTLMIGQCYFVNAELLENLDIPEKLQLLRLRPSFGYDDKAPKLFARTVKILARFTSKLQLDLYHYRWDRVERFLNSLLKELPNCELVASRGETNHYLFEVDLHKMWQYGWPQDDNE